MLKKFLIINVILFMVFITINIVADYLVNQSLSQEFVGEFEVYDLENDYFDYVNVGTSHGSVSFDWKNTNLNGLNLGNSGQPLVEDLFLLDYYNLYFNDQTTVIIPISFHTFCMSQEFSSRNQTLYLDDFKLLGMVRANTVMDFFLNRKYGEYISDNFDLNRLILNSIHPSDCSETNQNEAISIIDEIIKTYPNSVLVTTPYYFEALSSIENFDDFYDLVNQISETHSIPYYDYSRDERFHDTDFFYNSTHLNTYGREKFTNILFEEALSQNE